LYNVHKILIIKILNYKALTIHHELEAYLRMLFFWVVTPCRFVGRYRRFGEIYWPHPYVQVNPEDGNITAAAMAPSFPAYNP
jgi:hypothetical protein